MSADPPPESGSRDLKTVRRELAAAVKAFRARVRIAQDNLRGRERAYARRVEDAERALARAEAEHRERVAGAERALVQAQNPPATAAYGNVRLFHDRVETPHGVLPL